MAQDIFTRFNSTRDWSLGAAMHRMPSKKRRAKWAETVAKSDAEKSAPPAPKKPKLSWLALGFVAAVGSLIIFPRQKPADRHPHEFRSR